MKYEKKEKIRIGQPVLSPAAADFLARVFGGHRPGAEFLIESAASIYDQTLAEMHGRFSRPELNLILDALNGLYVTPCLSGQHLGVNVADHIRLNRAAETFGVPDADDFQARIRSLSAFHAVALEWWAMQFWNGEYGSADFVAAHLGKLADAVGDAE